MKIRKKITLFLLTKTEKEKPQFRRSTPKTVLNICLSYKPQLKGKFRCLGTVYVSMDWKRPWKRIILLKISSNERMTTIYILVLFPDAVARGNAVCMRSKKTLKIPLRWAGRGTKERK